MKRLLAKKWFRISVRVSVGCLSLLVLAWMWFNWWAASRKRLAVAAATHAGLSLNLEDFSKDMPPPEQNFARQGIFKQWEDAYEQFRPNVPASPSSPRGIYESFGDTVFGSVFFKSRRGNPRTAKFSRFPDDSPYGKTAESFLAEYDRRHGTVLEELRAGFALPYARRPFLPAAFSGDASTLPSLSEAFGMRLRSVSQGLALRAEAALETGDSAKAAESIEMILRLSEAMGSRGMFVSGLMQAVGIRTALMPLERGIREHRWTAADLDRIEAALRRFDIRRTMERAIRSEILMVHAVERLKSAPQPGQLGDPRAILEDYEGGDLLEWLLESRPHWLPDGFFDLSEAVILETTQQSSSAISSLRLGKDWWSAAQDLRRQAEQRWGPGKLASSFPVGAFGLEAAAHGTVEIRLALAACALEKYKLQHGIYPESLDAIDSEVATDPFHGVLFRYFVKDDAFRLYSLGPDGIDGGGVSAPMKSDKTQDDWVW
ncbi:hypothetical protein OJ996_12835 [Luteolibacter sp. GHJ8]|uniref:DUF885 family protein n=1 Tax=Luteolibacter rhizosphaerae TaxID=2989719 RepID=A0ABT3G3P5_9BACT|nr:hypothetical protein [Luteolibacter rhizosphaerae]MCW1914466.1 hypothetical protein [Luteolibacter rhizosphaerae]